MQNFYQIRITSNLLSDFLFVDALLSGFDLTIKKKNSITKKNEKICCYQIASR